MCVNSGGPRFSLQETRSQSQIFMNSLTMFINKLHQCHDLFQYLWYIWTVRSLDLLPGLVEFFTIGFYCFSCSEQLSSVPTKQLFFCAFPDNAPISRRDITGGIHLRFWLLTKSLFALQIFVIKFDFRQNGVVLLNPTCPPVLSYCINILFFFVHTDVIGSRMIVHIKRKKAIIVNKLQLAAQI